MLVWLSPRGNVNVFRNDVADTVESVKNTERLDRQTDRHVRQVACDTADPCCCSNRPWKSAL